MPDTDDKRPFDPHGNRFSDDLKQLAYEIWLWKANRNATRTAHLLAEEIRAESEEAINRDSGEIPPVDEESLPIPTTRQVQRWVKLGEWDRRADDEVARIAPQLYKRSNVRLFTTVPIAQQWDFDYLTDVCSRPNLSAGQAAICEKVSGRVQTFAGVGTAAGLMPVAMPQAAPQAINGAMSPQDMARLQREKIRELRDGR